MKMRLSAIALAIVGGAASLGMSASALAGNVGHYDGCGFFTLGDLAGPIAAAGHTKVTVATLDAGSLAGLDALVVTSCYGGPFTASNAALNTAVSNGMGLVVESLGVSGGSSGINSANLPGAPAFSTSAVYAYPVANNIELAAGSPISNGPGGTLTATSLDRGTPTGETFNFVFLYPSNQLPAGAIPFLTTANSAQVVAFGYNHGTGRVAYADSQASIFLPGGQIAASSEVFSAGLSTYLSNAIAWAAGYNPVTTTCASEGYTGTKLSWCKNICEMGYTGATLDMWIHRWIGRYRDLPYCAAAPASPPA